MHEKIEIDTFFIKNKQKSLFRYRKYGCRNDCMLKYENYKEKSNIFRLLAKVTKKN